MFNGKLNSQQRIRGIKKEDLQLEDHDMLPDRLDFSDRLEAPLTRPSSRRYCLIVIRRLAVSASAWRTAQPCCGLELPSVMINIIIMEYHDLDTVQPARTQLQRANEFSSSRWRLG